MHNGVKLGLDKSSSLPLPAFMPEEIDYWLNEAQLQIVKQKAFGNNYRTEAFEGSIKRIEDLAPLVKIAKLDSFSHPFYENVKYFRPAEADDYMFFVEAVAGVADVPRAGASIINITNITRIGTTKISHADIKNFIQTEFNIPYIKNPLVYFYDNKIGCIHDPYKTVTSLYVTYIKYPDKLVRTVPGHRETNVSELPEQAHQEIVALTINLLLENIESQRQESNTSQLNKKE